MSAIHSTSVEPRTMPVYDTDLANLSPSVIPQALPGETIIYQDTYVRVNNQQLVLATKTYQLASIHAMDIRKLTTPTWPIIGLAIIGGTISAWLFTYSLLIGAATTLGIGVSILGLIFSIKPNYILRISTAEREMDALMSIDRAYIQRIHDTITALLDGSKP